MFPLVLTVAVVLLNVAVGSPVSLDFTSPISLFGDAIALVIPAILGVPPMMVLVGYAVVWFSAVCIMAWYIWKKTYEIKDCIFQLAEHYGRYDIEDRYEDALSNMRFYDSAVVIIERLNIEMFNELLRSDNRRQFGYE